MTATSYSVMGGYLQRHAYENVWCTPTQDRQTIFELHRISPDGGVWVDFKVMWRTLLLPEKKARFHVYQIGQIHPLMLGLKESFNEWVLISDAMMAKGLMADIYTVNGLQVHRGQVWYRLTPEKDLIVAIKLPDPTRFTIDLDKEAIFLRLYTNAYFQSPRAESADDCIVVKSERVVSTQDILDIQNQLRTYQAKAIGFVTCYLNGWRVDTLDLLNAVVGDYLEFIYDGSVKRVVTYPVSSLLQFVSTLDTQAKYLLHYAGNVGEIEYHDDVDFFVVRPDAQRPGRFRGIYYHKNNPQAVRMVTHQDYSLPVQYLMSYAQAHSDLSDLGSVDDLLVIAQIRNSGYARPLVNEYHRIKDLYLLPEDEVVQAMTGLNATVEVWKAASLEASPYCALMRAELGEVSTREVQEAYGYGAVSVLIANTPELTTDDSGAQRIELPSGLANACTVYEYDANGLLLGWYPHTSGSSYECSQSSARLCEALSGLADTGLDAYWNVASHVINPELNYRFYTCGVQGGVADEIWEDVTGSDQYSILNDVVTWLTNPSAKATLVRSNAKHIAYQFNFAAFDSLITFSLLEYRQDLRDYRALKIPLGELTVFLNGRTLIEGLDYIVDFPRVTICNKEYLVDPQTTEQKLAIRFTNFCDKDFKRTPVSEVGFVQYGCLSFNNRYDIRDDQVQSVVVQGELYSPSELTFAESDFEVHVTGARNGFPYQIRDIVVPMNDYLESEADARVDPTYRLRQADLKVIKSISDYMTLKIAQKKPSEPSAIVALYRLVSPFFCRIIYDLKSGALWDDAYTEQYSDDYVREQCTRYEYILAWDPITDANLPDLRFCVIHPHNLNNYVDLNVYQYKFLTRVQRIYAPTRIALSGSVRVTQF